MASGDVNFSKCKAENLKKYLFDCGIQFSGMEKGKRRTELLQLFQNAAEMKQQKLKEVVESFNRVLEEKLETNEGLLSNPNTLHIWSHKFASIPELNSHLLTCVAT